MKILKNKTYSKLLKEIDELKQEKSESEEHERNLLNEIRQKQKEFEKYIAESKMDFTIKRLVIGKKASGKTTFIKSLLPKIKSFYIIDFTGEYDFVPESNRYFIDSNEKHDVTKILDKIEQNNDKLIILEYAGFLGSIDWFMLNSESYNFIITGQSKKTFDKYVDKFDCIYDLGTIDNWIYNKPDKNKVISLKRNDEEKIKDKKTLTPAKFLMFLGSLTAIITGAATALWLRDN